MNLLSKKKFRFLIFGLLLVVVIGFVASQPNKIHYGVTGTLLANNLNRESQIKILENINKKDTDNDGLKDWEEILWNTNPKDPDSDGDGTKDGDEIETGRDPLKKGPNDEVDNKPFVQSTNTNTFKNLTNTDVFAQNLFTQYLSLRGSNKSIDDVDKNLLVSSVVDTVLNKKLSKKYKIADLNIVNNTSSVILKKYGNDFARIIQSYADDLQQNELEVFERMLKTENQEDAMYLNNSSAVYDSAINELRVIEVPNDLAFVHLDILNSYVAVSIALKDMSMALDDPIRGLNGFSIHINTKDSQIGMFKEIRDYFIDNKIIFNTNEAGYLWHTI